MKNAKYKMQNVKCKMQRQNAECRAPSTKHQHQASAPARALTSKHQAPSTGEQFADREAE
jgi:hypothetical protein